MAAFTTIAAGVGLATSLAGSGASFAQAAKQKREQRRAESAADRAMKEAKAEMRKNYLDQLAITKEPFEFQREMMAQQTAQALAGLQEGDPRGLAAGVGRVAGVGAQAAQQMRADMSQEIQRLEQMKAQEDVRLASSRADLALEEAKGAGAAAAQAANLRAQGVQQGVQGIVDAGTSAMQFAALYEKTPDPKKGVTFAEGVEQIPEDAFGEVLGSTAPLDEVGFRIPEDAFGKVLGSTAPLDGSDPAVQAAARQAAIQAAGAGAGAMGLPFNPFNIIYQGYQQPGIGPIDPNRSPILG